MSWNFAVAARTAASSGATDNVAAEAAPFPSGGAWSRSGTIVFAPDVIMSGLRRVGAGGGSSEQATRLDISGGDTSHAWRGDDDPPPHEIHVVIGWRTLHQ